LSRIRTGKVLQRSSSRVVTEVETAEGLFVAKLMAREAALGLVAPTGAQIDHALQVFDFLALRDFTHAPKLLKTCSGNRFADVDGKVVYLMEHIEGSQPVPSPMAYAALGRVAAKLNAYTDFPYEYPISVPGTIDELTAQAEQSPFRDAILQQIAKLAVLADQPRSLIHGEINCANAIQTPDGRIVVVDWDAAGTGPAILEAGYPLITSFLTEDCTFHHDWARAFYAEYTTGLGMTDGTKEMLFTAALLHALRYMPFHNPIERWNRILYAVENKDLLLSAIPTRSG
jgi:aminoglycoside phosphotransferase (APT) family kinase protein